MSVDGYLDDTSETPLTLSSIEDRSATAELRVWADAILVGGETVRRDRPDLRARSDSDRSRRLASARSADPHRIVWTRSGDLDGDNPFFTVGNSTPYVVGPSGVEDRVSPVIRKRATILSGAETPEAVIESLKGVGVRNLLVEGGALVHGQWFGHDCYDEFRLAIAPIVLGSKGHASVSQSLASPPWSTQRMIVTGQETLGDTTAIFLFSPERDGSPVLPMLKAGTQGI
jgi:5-amino-6-(5-phosphoribosylamino)uracil reductase